MIGWPFRRPSARPDVVFIGDSLTQFWPENDPALFRRGRINRGISGETSAGMRARFDRDVAALGPRAVHIMAGTNDVWHGRPGPDAAAARGNVRAMARAAAERGIRPIVAAPPPVSPAAVALFGHPELLPVLRAGIRADAEADGAVFVDYAEALGGGGLALRPAFTTDGVHLTRRGYRAMRAPAERAIRAALA